MKLLERMMSVFYGVVLGFALAVQAIVTRNPDVDLHGLFSFSLTITGLGILMVAFETYRHFHGKADR